MYQGCCIRRIIRFTKYENSHNKFKTLIKKIKKSLRVIRIPCICINKSLPVILPQYMCKYKCDNKIIRIKIS